MAPRFDKESQKWFPTDPEVSVLPVGCLTGRTLTVCSTDFVSYSNLSFWKTILLDLQKEGPAAGYGIIGSLYRAGPVPFFQRIVNADTYEQAVLKYMAQEGCDRVVSMIF